MSLDLRDADSSQTEFLNIVIHVKQQAIIIPWELCSLSSQEHA